MLSVRLPLLVLLGLLLAPPAGAGDSPRPPRLADVLAGGRYVSSLPAWQWHPTRPRLLRRAGVKGGQLLLEVDPADPGNVATRLDWRALAGLTGMAGGGVEGVGRQAAPGWVPDPRGDGILAVVNGHLVWVPGGDEEPRVLTRGMRDPVAGVDVAPGGRWVSFTQGHDVWVVDTRAGKPTRLTHGGSETLRNGSLDWVVPEELSLVRGTTFAPDARHLAYVQLDERGVGLFEGEGVRIRYPRAGTKNPRFRVGVVAVEGGETTWLDLGSPPPEYVARIAWFPGGRRVAVVTLDRAQRMLRLLACPIDGSPSTAILEEQDDAWVDVPPAPHFVDEHRFLWRSHGDGATRWYLATLPKEVGGCARRVPLTAEHIDVPDRPILDVATGRAIYVGTRHGAMRARPYVGLDGDEAPFAPPPGFHTEASIDPTGTWAVVTWSNATTPPRRDLRRVPDGHVLRSFGDARKPRLEELALARPQVGVLETESGAITWRLWRAPGADLARPRPVIVRVYGGPDTRLVVDRWQRSIFLNSWLAGAGYHVLEVDGRGARGRGKAHVRLIARRLGLSEIDDQAAAVRHVATFPDVDGERVGIFGWSFGGTLTCLGLTRHADLFRVGVAIAPVTDWRLYDTIYTERYLGLPAANLGAYRETAATTYAALLRGHLLLLHGTDDENVHVENTERFAEALRAAGRKTFDVKLYPGRGHGIGGEHRDLYQRLLRFFAEHL